MNNIQNPLPKALSELFRVWQPPGAVSPRPEIEAVFSAGHSNRNFLVRKGGLRFVVRIPDIDSARLGVDRKVEQLVLARAEQIGLGANVLYCDADKGILVTSYLESRPLRVEGLRADDAIDRLGAALQLLHAQDMDIPAVHIADRVRLYLRDIQAAMPTVWPRARRWLASARPYLEQYRFARRANGLCHHDLVASNILDVGGCIRIIDWEYAGRGDPFFDLATLAEEHGFDELDRRRLLLSYGEFGDAAAERLYRCQVLHRLLSLLWFVLRFRELKSAELTELPALLRHEHALESLLKQGPGS